MANQRMGTADLLDAIAFAATKHRNQRRKDAEASPYINHLGQGGGRRPPAGP